MPGLREVYTHKRHQQLYRAVSHVPPNLTIVDTQGGGTRATAALPATGLCLFDAARRGRADRRQSDCSNITTSRSLSASGLTPVDL